MTGGFAINVFIIDKITKKIIKRNIGLPDDSNKELSSYFDSNEYDLSKHFFATGENLEEGFYKIVNGQVVAKTTEELIADKVIPPTTETHPEPVLTIEDLKTLNDALGKQLVSEKLKNTQLENKLSNLGKTVVSIKLGVL
ncbi:MULTISPECIES: hypothetical protein [Bacillus]|uniref:hypothetical protein n=1 Tax=Bacillus TaxID=1386 RepID=UPI0009349C61|nr:hypothetical protein [Bacillus subtilis]MBO3635266.1 hypothetical protein [Bacillus subtilis]MDR4182215.1 hypothetical protein [Bacillus subtilis]QHJ97744.1 hypothetical protein C7M17_00825 [Bacillus subtilis]URM16758.1 hypothetical protein JNE32_11895 [Bacillus subtilis]UXM89222.1 hypothetical protein N8A75_09460 [Bacillus subtilis]